MKDKEKEKRNRERKQRVEKKFRKSRRFVEKRTMGFIRIKERKSFKRVGFPKKSRVLTTRAMTAKQKQKACYCWF